MDVKKEILKILNDNEFGELALKGNRYITGVRTEHFGRIAQEITDKLSGSLHPVIESQAMKPCPFCGCIPIVIGKLGRYKILHKCDAIQTVIGVGKKSEIIKIWNTRA